MQSMVFALLAAFLAVLAMGPFVIEKLRRLNFGATERNYGLETHNKKTGTPIMGGIMILAALALAALVFSPAQMRWSLMLPAVLFALGFGGIGFLDDFIKAVRKRPEGLSAKQKIALLYGKDADFTAVLAKAADLRSNYNVTVLQQAKKLGKQLGQLEASGFSGAAFMDKDEIKIFAQQ